LAISPPSSSRGGGGINSFVELPQSPTFPRHTPSGMRSPTTPNSNPRSFSGPSAVHPSAHPSTTSSSPPSNLIP
jgi:hypothetical protein